jgi:DNA primase
MTELEKAIDEAHYRLMTDLHYSPEAAHDLVCRDFIQGRGISVREVIDYRLGIGNIPEVTSTPRLLFPTYTPHYKQSSLVGICGRTLYDDETKFLHSRGFERTKNLWGLYQAQNLIVDCRTAILVESYFDVLSLHRCHITLGISMYGSSLSREQAALLARYTDRVAYIPHRDKAMPYDTEKVVEVAKTYGINVAVFLLPDFPDVTVSDFDDLVRFDEKVAVHWLHEKLHTEFTDYRESWNLREWLSAEYGVVS